MRWLALFALCAATAQGATFCVVTTSTAPFPPVCKVCPGYVITERIDANGAKVAVVRCPPDNRLALELPPGCTVPKANRQLDSYTPVCR